MRKNNNDKKKPKEQLKKYLQLTGITFQMGITIYIFTYLGKILDEKYPQNIKLFTLILSILGVLVSLYIINNQLKKINSK